MLTMNENDSCNDDDSNPNDVDNADNHDGIDRIMIVNDRKEIVENKAAELYSFMVHESVECP